MAEGMLSGIIGDTEEKSDIEATDALAGAEAFASAVAAKLAGNDPEVARRTVDFLIDQSQLLRVQKKHLEDEHATRLHFLHGQAREVDIRRFGLRLRVAFQLFIALVATVFGIGFSIILWEAVTSHRVVVEPFYTLPSLAVRKTDGVVIANGLLDELNHLQDATRSDMRKLDQSTAWSNQVKLEVPETGLSLSEIAQLLRERYGRDVHIAGDLIETPAGDLALTIRGKGLASKTFKGAPIDLENLTTQAAEYVYAQSQPVRWAYYLQNTRRYADAIAFCSGAALGAASTDRPYLLNVWANALGYAGGSPQEALALYRAAIKLKPDLWGSYSNSQLTLVDLGDEEGAWRAGEQMRTAAGGRPGRAQEVDYRVWDALTKDSRARLLGGLANADSNGGMGTLSMEAGMYLAVVHIELHDAEAAELAMKTTRGVDGDSRLAAISHLVRGRMAMDAGDTARAAAELEAFGAAYADPDVSGDYPGENCWIAPAEEAAGNPGKADEVLKTGGTFVNCYRFHGDVLARRGDWEGAQQWYAKAVTLAPDLPAGYYSWGMALLQRSDLEGAVQKFNAANQHGPHWADPLKAWGDVLLKQGNIKAALVKYDEALTYAPNWKELKNARESSTKLLISLNSR